MIKLEWKINGRAVPANRGADELAKAARDGIARVRCPIHGSAPRNIRVSDSGDRLRFQYETAATACRMPSTPVSDKAITLVMNC